MGEIYRPSCKALYQPVSPKKKERLLLDIGHQNGFLPFPSLLLPGLGFSSPRPICLVAQPETALSPKSFVGFTLVLGFASRSLYFPAKPHPTKLNVHPTSRCFNQPNMGKNLTWRVSCSFCERSLSPMSLSKKKKEDLAQQNVPKMTPFCLCKSLVRLAGQLVKMPTPGGKWTQ